MIGFARVNEFFDVTEKNGIANKLSDAIIRQIAMEKPASYRLDGDELKVEYIVDDGYGLLILFRPNMQQLVYIRDGR